MAPKTNPKNRATKPGTPKPTKETPITKPMTKTAFIAELATRLDAAGIEASKKEVSVVLDTLRGVIVDQLNSAEKFVLPGVARFGVRHMPAVGKKEKKVRNPSNGDMVWQKPRAAFSKPTVRIVKQLKDALN